MKKLSIQQIIGYTLAFIWVWHGLVPKLILRHAVESSPLLAAGFSENLAESIVVVSGILEIAVGLLFLLIRNRRWLYLLTIFAMSGLTIGIASTSIDLFLQPFNPLTLNLALSVLAVIGLYDLRRSSSPRRTMG